MDKNVIVLLIALLSTAGCSSSNDPRVHRGHPIGEKTAVALPETSTAPILDPAAVLEDQIASAYGWELPNQRGHKILQHLAGLRQETANSDASAYRGEYVAFLGSAARSGATNDLELADGFYLRVVNPSHKDLRPQAVFWTVMVYGRILQIIPENKVIVIEVLDPDWKVIDTL